MIAGVGIDVVDASTFDTSFEGSAFLERTFTAHERATAASRPSHNPTLRLAARFAAKEACVKALSQALAPAPLPKRLADLTEIEVLVDDDARPSLALRGHVLALADKAGVVRLHVSLSHDGNLATALVIAER
jgi:holo-[acyl-carrier protein] synthase